MSCSYFIFVLTIGVLDAVRLKNDILEYYSSPPVDNFRQAWSHRKKDTEDRIKYTLQEQALHDTINKNLQKSERKIAQAFMTLHGENRISLTNLYLVELPRFWIPEIRFPLAQNIFKIDTRLTNMEITAQYALMRNKTDKSIGKNEQDMSRDKPLSIQPTQSLGKLNIILEGCLLSGYTLVRLQGEKIKLGHNKFLLKECNYIFEFPQSSPRTSKTATRQAVVPGGSFGIKQLVVKGLKKSVMEKIKVAIVNNVNIAGLPFADLKQPQSDIFAETRKILTEIVYELNQKAETMNDDDRSLEDFSVTWDDIITRTADDISAEQNKNTETIQLSNIKLTGLNTAYLSKCGGPYALDRIMIGEQIRFRKLQVHGDFFNTLNKNALKTFGVTITDLAVNVELHVQSDKPAELEVVGFRKLEFTEKSLKFNPVEGIIVGHLMRTISDVLFNFIKVNINKDVTEEGSPVPEGSCANTVIELGLQIKIGR